MMRRWVPSLIGTTLVGGVLTAVVLIAPNASSLASGSPSGTARTTDSADADSADGTDEKADTNENHGRALGPPSWANAHGRHGNGSKPSQANDWKDAWQQLTPAQRSNKMASLAKAHADGMRAWGDCVAGAGKSMVNLEKCEKPLPPGLAKRLP
jgi:hypothetical protein